MREDADEVQYFCEKCFSHPELIAEVKDRGVFLENCPICHGLNVQALSIDDATLRRMLRAFFRLYFSEFEYNEHVGGESLGFILFGKNKIFDLDSSIANEGEFEAAVSSVESGWYPPSDVEVSLGGGYWDGALLFSPYDWLDSEIYKIFARSLTTNYYELIEPLRALFISIRANVSRQVTSDLHLHRARKGFDKRYSARGEIVGTSYAFTPYSGKFIGAPPISTAVEGRFNRAHISVLYAASDESTAVSEIRPEPGQIVSVGKFKQVKPLLLADFSISSIKPYLTDATFQQLHRIISFDMVLSVPVADDARPIYLIPQLVADVIRSEGFDGIAFDSTLSIGRNYVIFKPEAFEFVEGSEAVCVVNKLQWKTSRLPVRSAKISKENDDWVEEPNTLASTLDGLIEMHRRRVKGARRERP